MPQKQQWAIAMEEEAKALHKRFNDLKATTGMGQAEFARVHKVPGGASMVSQHIKGRRPMNLDAAAAYAEGFKVPLHEISARIAKNVEFNKARASLAIVHEDGAQSKGSVVDSLGAMDLPASVSLEVARQNRWPYTRVDFDKLVALRGVDARNLENALLAAAGDLDLDIRVRRSAKTKAA